MTNVHPAPHFGLVLDCADPERLAEFWAEALGYANVGSAGVYVALYPREGNGPKLLLQRVREPKSIRNLIHLYIEVPDIYMESDRLCSLAAPRVNYDTFIEHCSTFILISDP